MLISAVLPIMCSYLMGSMVSTVDTSLICLKTLLPCKQLAMTVTVLLAEPFTVSFSPSNVILLACKS